MSSDHYSTVTEKTIRDHISKTLTAAGHKCLDREHSLGWYPTWEVKRDSTIKEPEGCLPYYQWLQIELTSPAYWFSEDSIRAVMDVLSIIKSTYLVNVNESCGLHVHVGNGLENQGEFEFSTIRNLFALIFAFEPQLDTLHPSHRQNGMLFRAFRYHFLDGQISFNGKDPQNDDDPAPAAKIENSLTMISSFLRSKSIEDLIRDKYISAWCAYNFSHVMDSKSTDIYKKRTIEFRQHEGTLDGDRLKAWIQTVVGLVQLGIDMEYRPDLFTDLLRMAKFEEIDDDREKARLCEESFTVIDLLKALGLWEAALFYKQRGLYGPHRPSYYYLSPDSSPSLDPKPIRKGVQIPLLEGEYIPNPVSLAERHVRFE